MRLFHKKRHKVAKGITNRKIFTQKKKVYCNEKNCCNNIRVIAIVDMRCCNKIWGNKFVQQKILLQ